MSEYRFLSAERSLPDREARSNVVQWHVFRSRAQAEQFIPSVQLMPGQELVGGYSRDSVGAFWWVGVQVPDLALWGNQAAVNKRAG